MKDIFVDLSFDVLFAFNDGWDQFFYHRGLRKSPCFALVHITPFIGMFSSSMLVWSGLVVIL